MMKNRSMLAISLCMAMGVSMQVAAQTPMQTQTQTQTQMQERERIYGYEMMTPNERIEYRNRMRALKTAREREAFRLEHHKQMQARAKAQGKTLPDMPPAGMGPGSGMGPGMGPGSGMGSGMGPGRR
jgi:hypothetical protein